MSSSESSSGGSYREITEQSPMAHQENVDQQVLLAQLVCQGVQDPKGPLVRLEKRVLL
ncbi:Hypothetical predicted protein [Marmota monax]|uniref:Uncharacterized protein n=1 Tax=Marmota monax TaxID=9995 RepID=A0A5E4CSQ7_MARMO|nr:hypothetical protein GHT09_016975 [Marmota monax]VTJ84843.1 Hypothetical predicted protein [Marmota monax]